MRSRRNTDYEAIVRDIGADHLRAIRAETGQSQVEFAKGIGLGVKTYGNYERRQRELPQSARLAVIDKTGSDPLPTDALIAAARGDTLEEFGSRSTPLPENASLRKRLRAECKEFREKNYSRPARFLLAVRDHVFASASLYGFVDVHARNLEIPLGIAQPVADRLLVASFVIVVMLIVPVLSDLPVARLVGQLIRRSPRRRF